MKLLKKYLVLVSLMGWGNAYAVLLQIELTGNLDYGYQSGSDTFGVGSSDLAGQEATFRYMIDTEAVRTIGNYISGIEQYSGSIYGQPAGFVTSSVTLNNVTRSVAGDYWSRIRMDEDQDASGWGSYDYLYIDAYDNNYATLGSVETYNSNYIEFHAQDYVNSILEGLDLNQLNGWSVNNPYNGRTSFNFVNYVYDYSTYSYLSFEATYGQINLNNVRIWGDGLNGGTTPVSEPDSLALLAGGLGLLATRRSMRR